MPFRMLRTRNCRCAVAAALAASVFLLVAPQSQAQPVAELVEKADALYEVRAVNQVRGLASREPIGEVVDLYERALAAEPDNLAISWKLLQALEYKGIHALPEGAPERCPVFDRAREVCERALDQVAMRFGGRDALYRASPQDLRRHGIDPVVLSGVYLWGAIDWAAWAKCHGKMAAVLQGVAGRIHDYTNQILALDPAYREGAGYRLLAQLHISVPHVPFVTGWVDRDKAVVAMDQAEAVAPGDPHNKLFLAEVLLAVDPRRRSEIEGLLRETSSLVPRTDRVAEDWELKNKADELLAIHYPD